MIRAIKMKRKSVKYKKTYDKLGMCKIFLALSKTSYRTSPSYCWSIPHKHRCWRANTEYVCWIKPLGRNRNTRAKNVGSEKFLTNERIWLNGKNKNNKQITQGMRRGSGNRKYYYNSILQTWVSVKLTVHWIQNEINLHSLALVDRVRTFYD